MKAIRISPIDLTPAVHAFGPSKLVDTLPNIDESPRSGKFNKTPAHATLKSSEIHVVFLPRLVMSLFDNFYTTSAPHNHGLLQRTPCDGVTLNTPIDSLVLAFSEMSLSENPQI